jgi:hypothetical protein
MNLPTPAGDETSARQGSQSPAVQQDQTAISNYYYDQGPPIVTYYPPPPYYAYLYGWVPYPTFWFGFWYPGFYICNNFTTVVVVKSFDHNHREHFRRGIVSNRFFDPATKRHAVVDPVIKTRDGKHRSTTMLRTRNGEQFKNIAEMRRYINRTGFRNRDPGTSTNAFNRSGFRSPEARKSAEAIYSRSLENMRMHGIREGSRNPSSERRYMPPNTVRDGYTGERRYVAPNRVRERNMNLGGERLSISPNTPARPFSTPSGEGERRSDLSGKTFRSPSSPVVTPVMRQGGEPVRNFTRTNVPSYSGGGHVSSTDPSARAFRDNGRFSSNGSGRYLSR